MRGMVGEVPPEDDPAHVLSGVAFATALQSNNFFVTPVTGKFAGKIFYADHEDWNQNVFASSFEEFLERVMEEPIGLFSKLGGSIISIGRCQGCGPWGHFNTSTTALFLSELKWNTLEHNGTLFG